MLLSVCVRVCMCAKLEENFIFTFGSLSFSRSHCLSLFFSFIHGFCILLFLFPCMYYRSVFIIRHTDNFLLNCLSFARGRESKSWSKMWKRDVYDVCREMWRRCMCERERLVSACVSEWFDMVCQMGGSHQSINTLSANGLRERIKHTHSHKRKHTHYYLCYVDPFYMQRKKTLFNALVKFMKTKEKKTELFSNCRCNMTISLKFFSRYFQSDFRKDRSNKNSIKFAPNIFDNIYFQLIFLKI